MEASLAAVERILGYSFKNKKLLEDALTHPSYTQSESYQRLEFMGDAVLGLAFSCYIYNKYPKLEPGKLSAVRSANISTEKFARVAVRHKLYDYVRHNTRSIDNKIREFVLAVQNEDPSAAVHGGVVKAPKVLADIVEALAAAVFVDCNFELKEMWKVFSNFLEPMVPLELLELKPQPVATLFELCQKYGKQVQIDYCQNGGQTTAKVTIDGQFVASASSEQKENAKLNAAKAALLKISYEPSGTESSDIFSKLNEHDEIEGAKQKLHELCSRKKWLKPKYKIEKEVGRDHAKRFVCSVKIELAEGILFVTGKEKSRVRESENSAASSMISGLRDSKYL